MKPSVHKKGIMALEEINLEPQILEVLEPVVEANFLFSPEIPILEMGEAGAELDYLQDNIAEAVETVDVLDEINEAVKMTEGIGGLSEPVADALAIAVEHFTSRLGMTSRKVLFPSMEDFAAPSSRKGATKIAMEGIADVIKRIWAEILATFERVISWVADFFNNHEIAARRLINRAVKLKKRIDAMGKTDDVAEGSVADSHTRFVKHLTKDGESLAPAAFVKNFEAYVKEEYSELKVMEKGLSSLAHMPTLLKATLAKGFDENQMNNFMMETISEVGDVMRQSVANYAGSSNKDIVVPENCDLLEKKMPFGGVSKYAVIPGGASKDTDLKELRQATNRIKFFNAPSTGMKEADFGTSSEVHVDGLTLREAHDVVYLIENHLSAYASINRSAAVIKVAGKYFREMSDYASSLDPKYTGTGKAQLAACVSNVIAVFTTQFIKNSLMYDLSLCNAALEYCAVSIRKAG